MRFIVYFLPLLFSLNIFAEYFQKDTCNNDVKIKFLNNVSDSRIRKINISKDQSTKPLSMIITFDGPAQKQNAEKLACIFESKGAYLDKYFRITTSDFGKVPKTKLWLKSITSEQIDVYSKALDIIHEFEAIEPMGMLNNIKAEIGRLAIVQVAPLSPFKTSIFISSSFDHEPIIDRFDEMVATRLRPALQDPAVLQKD